MLRSFDTCFANVGQTTGVRAYCVANPSSALTSWTLYEKEYSDSTCTNARASTAPSPPLATGPACDSNGNAVSCASTLANVPLSSAPRGFIENVYSSPTCDSAHVYARVITPQGGCTVITVERTDTLPNGQDLPLTSVQSYFKISSCEWVNNGYVAFGTLHIDNKCQAQGFPTSHTLPRGCMTSPGNQLFSSTFTCG